MTQVSDEMVEAAMKSVQRHAPFHISTTAMRAALEAALAVRKPIDPDVEKITGTLRSWAVALDIPSGPFANEDISAAADLIERQTEEIAELKADYLRRHKDACDRMEENIRLTAERAELIEALRPFTDPMQTLPSTNTMRARALLERLGAKEVG